MKQLPQVRLFVRNRSRRRASRPALALLGIFAFLAFSPTSRADEPAHAGFYFRVGNGPTFLTLRGHGPSGAPASLTGLGRETFLSLGGGLAPGLSLAGTLRTVSTDAEFVGGPFATATVTSGSRTSAASHKALGTVGALGLLLDWYPAARGGFHTGVAAGVGTIALTNGASNETYTGADLSGSAFAGYDWRLGSKWSLGVQLMASGATPTTLKTGSADTGYQLTPLTIGMQASLVCF